MRARAAGPTRHLGFNTVQCLAQAGDCAAAWEVFEANPPNDRLKGDAL